MKVTLGVYSDHPTPANCAMVGQLEESGVSYRLALDTMTRRYVAITDSGESLDFLEDQAGILDAIIVAYGRASPLEAGQSGRYISCKLDRWAADAIRTYGDGNLARGARKLAKILVSGRVTK